jgi:hypothetical protein
LRRSLRRPAIVIAALSLALLLTTGVAPADEAASTPEAVSEPVAPLSPPLPEGSGVAVSEPVAPVQPPSSPEPPPPPPPEEPPEEGPTGGGGGAGEGEPEGEPPFEEPVEPELLSTRKVFIGTNDAAGWGPAPAEKIRKAHIAWARVNIFDGSTPELAGALKAHFLVLGIVGNTLDSTPIAGIVPSAWAERVLNAIRNHPGITIAEGSNEVYLKGGRPEPVQYGLMYLAAVNLLHTAGVHVPLLFNMRGDYQRPNGEWSLDSAGGGWLRDAVNGVPGLAAAIRANGIAIHPYGALTENSHDTYGVRAAAADEGVAKRVLGTVPKFYITEFGYALGACGATAGACTLKEQASKLKAAYKAFIADPHVEGIWWYQSHDDSTGRWGFMNNDNTTRPAFGALSTIAGLRGKL